MLSTALMMLWAILPAEADAAPVSETLRTSVRILHIPNQIAPAVAPYVTCLRVSRGLALPEGAGDLLRNNVGVGTDCSNIRKQAEQDALKAVQANQDASQEQQTQLVEETLRRVDAYFETLPGPRMDSSKSGLSGVVGIPVTMEDEVYPAFQKYRDCLESKVQGTPMTAATVHAAFEAALHSCTDQRAESVSEAEAALEMIGWEEADRKQSVAATFERGDESWRFRGSRLSDALRQREGGRTQGTTEDEVRAAPTLPEKE